LIEISLKKVSFKYRENAPLVMKDINISFRSNEMTIIYGPNGSGKTTLMKIAALLYPPSEGEVLFNGENFWKFSDKKKVQFRRLVTYMHEKPILLGGTVIDNITLGLRLRGLDEENAKMIAMDWIDKLEMKELALKKASKLSAGQMQLVSIIRALVVSPEIIFLDEPLAHLDKNKRNMLLKILNESLNGKGIVITSHDESISSHFKTSRNIYIDEGRLSPQ